MVVLTEDQRKLLDRTMTPFCAAEKARKPYENTWNSNYKLYRGFSDWNQNVSGAERDRDLGLTGDKRVWGADLVIRIVFSNIETLVPKMVIHRPKMNIIPRDGVAASNVRNMKWLIDWQQQQINYGLELQSPVKQGLLYGLGVGKARWKTHIVKGDPYLQRREPAMDGLSEYVVGSRDTVVFDDPIFEPVDVFDFFWDYRARNIPTSRNVYHRVWLSDGEVMDRIKSGQWCTEGDPTKGIAPMPQLSAEDIEGMGALNKYDEIWATRLRAQGHENASQKDLKGGTIHEVIEAYDATCTPEYPRGCMTVILDRQVPVAHGGNPYWHGQFPFQICRPTEDPHRMVGISEPEVLEDYQEELSTLRGQRRDAATLALNPPMAYQEGLVDPLDFKWAPNMFSPVNGPPNELIQQLRVQDVPASGYQEEAAIKADIDLVSGISDAVRGADPGGGATSATATGAMLVSASANARITLKTMRCELEMMGPAAYQFGRLNQQKIISNRDVPIPSRPDPQNPGEMVWSTVSLGPDELAGTFAYVPVGGSTAPENVPQQRQDGERLWSTFSGNEHVDQRLLSTKVLELFGEKQPETLLTPPQPGLPPGLLSILQKITGADDRQIQLAVSLAQQQQDPMSAQDTGAGQPQQQMATNGTGNGAH